MTADLSTGQIYGLILRHHPRSPKGLTPEMRFEQDLGGDSLNFVELIMELESVFRISLPDGEVGSLQTVGELTALVQKKITAKTPGSSAPSVSP